MTGRYQPILLQIDHTNAGASVTELGSRASWGLKYADIIYEMPLNAAYVTRLTVLFSDLMPTAVGAVRSARINSGWLRAEWEAALASHGYQDAYYSSVPQEIMRTSPSYNEAFFSGTDGAMNGRKIFVRRTDAASPFNVTVNLAALSALVPDSLGARQRAFLFTDEAPDKQKSDSARRIEVVWGKEIYNYTLVWNAKLGAYQQELHHTDGTTELFSDRETGEPILYQNVIIECVDTEWIYGDGACPRTLMIGRGNAEYFMGGRHLAGVWSRPEMTDQTVYYTTDGEELALMRGRTLIVMLPEEREANWK